MFRSFFEPISTRHYLPGGREHGGGIGRLVGYIVDEVGLSGERHAISDTRGEGLTLFGSPFRLSVSILTLIGDRIRNRDCLQHIHIAGRGSTIRKLILTATARAVGSAHILHLHDPNYGDDLARRCSLMRWAVARMFRRADRVVVLGVRDRDIVEHVLGVAPQRIEVLHNAVPDPDPKLAFDHPENAALRVLFLGQLSKRKGVPELLRALASERMHGIPWRAILAGDGPVETYRREAVALGIGDCIDLPGWVGEAEVRRLCARSDVLVLPSHAEGMAMAVLEGMANGLSVVTTRVGAHEEILRDNETAVLLAAGDPDALAAALADLARDPARRERLARNARAYFLENLSISAYSKSLRRLYAAIRARRIPSHPAAAHAMVPDDPARIGEAAIGRARTLAAASHDNAF